MAAVTKDIDHHLLGRLRPFAKLSANQLAELASQSTTYTVNAGDIIYEQGKAESTTLFLISGQVAIFRNDELQEVISADSPRALEPLTEESRRSDTGRANTNCAVLAIDSHYYHNLAHHQTASHDYEVEEIDADEGGQWLNNYLRSPAFLRVPAENIQSLLRRMDEVPVKTGQVVISQGAKANNYYLIKAGQYRVTRKPSPEVDEIEVALLTAGMGFGEDAIISQGRRNASVTAKEDGTLMRLSTHNFMSLLVEPLLVPVAFDSAMERIRSGATFVDVRTPQEHKENGIKGSINVPLSLIRANINLFERRGEYIVYCNNGNVSAAAAFVLSQHSIAVKILAGGLAGIAARSNHHLPRVSPEHAGPDVVVKISRSRAAKGGQPGSGGESSVPLKQRRMSKADANAAESKRQRRLAEQADLAREQAEAEVKALKAKLAEMERAKREQQTPEQRRPQVATPATTVEAKTTAEETTIVSAASSAPTPTQTAPQPKANHDTQQEIAKQIAQRQLERMKAQLSNLETSPDDASDTVAIEDFDTLAAVKLETATTAANRTPTITVTSEANQSTQAAKEPPANHVITALGSPTAPTEVRDDSQLWTSVPALAGLPGATIDEHTGTSATEPNILQKIVCIESEDTDQYMPQVPNSARRPKTDPKPAAATATPATANDTAGGELRLGWVSDQFLWDTVIGYRSDPEVDKLLMGEQLELAPQENSREPVPQPTPKPVPAKPVAAKAPTTDTKPVAAESPRTPRSTTTRLDATAQIRKAQLKKRGSSLRNMAIVVAIAAGAAFLPVWSTATQSTMSIYGWAAANWLTTKPDIPKAAAQAIVVNEPSRKTRAVATRTASEKTAPRKAEAKIAPSAQPKVETAPVATPAVMETTREVGDGAAALSEPAYKDVSAQALPEPEASHPIASDSTSPENRFPAVQAPAVEPNGPAALPGQSGQSESQPAESLGDATSGPAMDSGTDLAPSASQETGDAVDVIPTQTSSSAEPIPNIF